MVKYSTVKTLAALVLLMCYLLSNVSWAAGPSNHKIIDGVSIYIGIMPAEMILGYPKRREERKMHGQVPSGAHKDHVVVALFDDASGERITDAQVVATVNEVGLNGETKRLDPMKIAGTITYGNYFDMPTPDAYRIQLQIRRPNAPGIIHAEFTHMMP